MIPRLNISLVALLILLLCGVSLAQSSSTFTLGERIACRTAVEKVYWQHRATTQSNAAASMVSFEESVPSAVIQRNAEDAVLKSAALERFWGVSITGSQLQAELDRMASNSKAPEVLAELFAAVGSDPQKAAECIARPLLVDRLMQTYYSSDERFHGALKARALSELSIGTLSNSSGQYREIEWRRGRGTSTDPGVIQLSSADFDARAGELKHSLARPSGKSSFGGVRLREDSDRFYAVSVLALEDSRLHIASVEWQKTPFETWWAGVREQLPMQTADSAFKYTLPLVAPNANCRDDSWKNTLQLLDPRYWHTAVWTGTEMIVWGGMSDVGTIYGDGSRYNPATDTWTPVSAKGAPSRRNAHSAVWTGREMVVFGGTGDRTGGRYNPVTDTWKPTSTTGAPTGQQYSSVVWTGKEMIVWGGILFSPVNTGGRYNPQTDTWAAMAPAPLAPRAYTPAVWSGTEMVVWAGYDVTIGQLYNDGARYNPTTNSWKKISTTSAPNARYWHTAVWTGSEMIVWGGVNYPTYDLSGGRYNPASDTWTPTSLSNPPSLRWLHAAAWTGKEMLIQGGSPGNATGGRYNPVTDSWTATNPTNAAVNGQGSTAVWTGREMIIWGGLDDDFVFHSDGARYNPNRDSWLRTSTMNVPAARGLHSALWTGSEMIVWGGFAGGFPNTGGRYDPATDSWKSTSTVGAPAGRENVAAVWTGTEAMYWGGDPDAYPRGTGGRYNPVTDSWKLITTTNAPIQRYAHTGVWTGTEFIIFGGVVWDDQGWRYNPAADSWKATSLTNSPGSRDHHVAEWTGNEMLVWGGLIYSLTSPVGSRYNPATDKWTPVATNEAPKTRIWAVDGWTGSEMIVWGGQDVSSGVALNDGGRYNPATNSWTKTTLTGAPSPREAQGVWSGKELLLWGGTNDSSGGRYNPASDSWKKTTLLNAPSVRGGGRWSTVWTGNQMIIWGGIIETQKGSSYCASGQPNIAPVAASDSYAVAVGKQLVVGLKSSVLLNDTDGNSDTLTAIAVTRPANGTVLFYSNGAFTYKANAGFSGTDTFTYRASDGLASSNAATVTITVQ